MTEDSPITISGGSPLTIEASENWSVAGDSEIAHPHGAKRVTGVDVTLPGGTPRSVAFAGERCEIEVAYGPLAVAAFTGPGGKGLRVRTSPHRLADHFDQPDGKRFVTRITDGSITAVAVKKNGSPEPGIAAAPGHTTIVIHYQ